jgi:hypothetical protein
VNYDKQLEMDSFFYLSYLLEAGKIQDLPNKIWQTVEDALRVQENLEISATSPTRHKVIRVMRFFMQTIYMRGA